MITAFRTLCTLDVTHEYYAGLCRDFDFVVPHRTAELLSRGRMLAKVLDGRLHVLFETGDGGAPLVSLAGEILRVGLVLRNPYFTNFTAATGIPTSAIAVYRRAPGAAVLAAPLAAEPLSTAFVHTLSKVDRPVTLTVKDPADRTVAVHAVPIGDAREGLSFDVSGFTPGLYRFVEDYPAAVQASFVRYLHHELTPVAMAVVEVAIDAPLYAAAQPLALSVPFTARKESLSYYLVVRDYTPVEFNQLVVADEGAVPKLAFTRIDAAAFTPAEIQPALLGNGDAKIALFRSTVTPRLARGRPRIELRRNNVVVIPHLPQPAADRTRADMIVHVSKKP
jgi:hypothetical protein